MASANRARDAGDRIARRLEQRLASELRDARLAAGLSQRHVGRVAGISQSQVSRVELAWTRRRFPLARQS